MTISKLQFKPGINREGTSYAEEGSWYDCDNIRFRSGNPEKIGGWVRTTDVNFKGVCRVMMNWTLLDSTDCIAMGTHKKFYIETNNAYYDITPIRATQTDANPITSGSAGGFTHTYTTGAAHGALAGDFVTISGAANVDGICTSTYTNPFKTTAPGSMLVQVNTVVPHYASAGQTVTFSGASGFDGIPAGNFNTSLTVLEVTSTTSFTIQVATGCTAGTTVGGGTVTAVFLNRLNREFEIVAVPSTTTFTFTTDTPCTTGGVNGGGAAVSAAFQVSIGFSANLVGAGWGAGTWSRGTWSSPYYTSISGISMRIWSVDNFGEDLVFCPRDGNLFYWDATSGLGVRGVLVSSLPGASDVPLQVSIVRVTDERHVLAIGATEVGGSTFDPLLIRWSDEEDVTNWTPAVTNTAGSYRIPMGSYVMTAIVTRQETLIWTEHSLHSLQFSGPPYTFSLQTLAENTSIVGPNAAINVNNVTFWMGKDRFWVYSGRAETLPCTVQRYVFDDIDTQQIAQTYAAVDDSFTEVKWFYCSNGSTVIDRCVTYNYSDKIWTIGSLSRTAWVDCPGRGGYPFATAGGDTTDNGLTFVHEVGVDDGSTNPPQAMTAYIESADFDIEDGDRLMFVDRIIPDLTFAKSTVDDPEITLTIEAKKFSGQAIQSQDNRTVSKVITASVDRYTNQVWARIRGRQMRIKVSSDALGVGWLLGALRINSRTDGKQ